MINGTENGIVAFHLQIHTRLSKNIYFIIS